MIPLVLVVLLAFGASPALAQAPDPTPRLDPVVVTTTRIEQRLSEAPASVTVIDRTDVKESASQTVDDLLRQVPGFSLFRRASSVVTHPTTQGVSLRGIGPSGTSRALVLLDGVPINDPFGGWVYWNRVPLQGIEQIEVVRGGGSSVWGNGALGGVINIITAKPTGRSASFEASYGSYDTTSFDLRATEVQGPFRIGIEGHLFDTDGYRVVKDSRRGRIDIEADSQHKTFNGRFEIVPSSNASVFVSGSYYREDRGNGTPLQVNDTQSGLIATGGRLRTSDGSLWSATVDAQFQTFRSTFTTQALDRRSETLALDQTVPSTGAGAALQWSRRFGAHVPTAGVDGRWVDGETDELRFTPAFVGSRFAGGQQMLGGVYVQDTYTPIDRLELVGGLRADYWKSYDGFRRDVSPTGVVTARQSFADVDRVIASPRLAGLLHATSSTDVRASGYQGFRVPTINELYRVFRVRNDVTTANQSLKPERLTGGELGVQQRWGPLTGRVTGYWNEVTDLIANVTLTTRLADCPVGTTCRQRQNLDRARIRGLESELELRPAPEWRVVASHLYVDTRVLEASQQRGLEGKRLAQVPENAATLSVRYENPKLVNVAVSARVVGGQFEDDLNTLPLGSYVVVDLVVSRALAKWAEVFFAIENAFDTVYAVGRTSEGVVSTGAPFVARAGLRLAF